MEERRAKRMSKDDGKILWYLQNSKLRLEGGEDVNLWTKDAPPRMKSFIYVFLACS